MRNSWAKIRTLLTFKVCKMNKADFIKFMNIIKDSYLSAEPSEDVLGYWYGEMKRIPLHAAEKALKLYQRRDAKNIKPTVGNIYSILQEILMPSLLIPFDEAKVKNTYLHQKAVRMEGSIKITGRHNSYGEIITDDDKKGIYFAQKTIYNRLVEECRNEPLEKLPKMQALLNDFDKRRYKTPNLVIDGVPTPYEEFLDQPSLGDLVSPGERKAIEGTEGITRAVENLVSGVSERLGN